MAKLKKILAIILASVLVAAMIFGLVIAGIAVWRQTRIGRYDFSPVNGAANKVILFVGDGMGFNHIKVASSYYDKQMFVNSLEVQGEITTFSRSILSPTDSAAAGSALSTGQKYYLRQVAQRNGNDIETIAETAKKQGLGVGIVTTDSLSGATPASFSAHAAQRSEYDDIISCQAASNFDLLLGAGGDRYASRKQDFIDSGYAYCSDMNELSVATGKIVAAFNEVLAANGTAENPTLEMLTDFAIDYMEANYAQGYFLMIEGAHIDKRSHSNDVFGMVEYMNSFDDSIKLACDKLQSAANLAVIVTADHETGNLQFNNQSKEQIDNSLYRREGHSSANVPYFLHLQTQKNVDIKTVVGKTMDNTDVYRLIRALINK